MAFSSAFFQETLYRESLRKARYAFGEVRLAAALRGGR
jgi:hypothetical protein